MAQILIFMQLFLKILSGMANSVDPDQTAPSGAVWSGSALFAYVILSDTLVFKILGHLLYINTFKLKLQQHQMAFYVYIFGDSNNFATILKGILRINWC